jgi:xylulokinase
MPDNFFGGLDFGTSGARISIINFKKGIKIFEFSSISTWL